MTRRSAALLILGLAACTTPTGPAPQPAPPAADAREDQGERLRALFAASDAAMLRRNPITAIGRGDFTNADQLGDYYSDSYVAAEKAAVESDLAALASIDRAALNATDQLAYDVFKFGREQDLKGFAPDILPLTIVRPINHFGGLQSFYPVFASGRSIAPFHDVDDYEDNLARHRQFGALVDRIIARFRQGLSSGVVDTKLTVRNMVEQIDNLLRDAPEASPFYDPIENFPAAVPAGERERLRQAHLAAIRDDIYPAYRRLRTFLQEEYLPRARDQVGLLYMEGGDRLYRRLIEENTTLPLEAQAVHELGLSEVARIRGEMETVKSQVGFDGTLAQFFEHLRTDPRFTPASREWLRNRYFEIGRTVDQRIGELFSHLPSTRLDIREVEAFRERTEAAGSYQDGAPDGSRPGVFYFNAYDLPARPVWGMETLYLHEGAPGHHFQIMLAAENEALPNFMRYGGNTAFVEGWALYAETLWDELGMETDPYQRFGGLNDEMLRAMRLVVDTGIHAQGWTRERAIRYMLENSGLTETDVTAEVERYIAIPGQALAYKLGQLKILELRARAEQALGSRFDIRAFHDQVLNTGSLPLTVLEEKIDTWIAEQRAG
ncbi:DUF885 domain-containing protein [Sphingosinicella sp. YJ22]|uniref:DUF885 domain-containing protein n=1 Tax=Sphingosinicella sp. YJ22 TaxID=1104780 RepID=UPI0014085813|nr:DUF885 domain-containing protein [Sphingosinicella sp. YJ22]